MFNPTYTITNRLLSSIIRIYKGKNNQNSKQETHTDEYFTYPAILRLHRTLTQNQLPTEASGVLTQSPTQLTELCQFVSDNKNSVHPIILAAIFYKQFLYLSPFVDKNKNVADYIAQRLLEPENLSFPTTNPLPQDHLNDSSNDFTPWIETFTDLLVHTNQPEPPIPKPQLILLPHHQLILTHLQTHPSISDADYAKLTPRAKSTRAADLAFLVKNGYLERKGKGKATFYVLKNLC